MANPYKVPRTETMSNRRAVCIERVHVRFGKGRREKARQRDLARRLLHSRIPLSYRAKSGRKTTQWHHPDFFVLHRQPTA
jgi:hypothetical protein